MDQPVVYAISDRNSEGIRVLLEQAISKMGLSADLRSFYDVDNQWDMERILLRAVNANEDPLVFYALQSERLASYLRNFCDLHRMQHYDLLTSPIHQLKKRLREEGVLPTTRSEEDLLYRRIDALDFALRYDDGKDIQGLTLADICLIGVSRTSKTPLSMYLANQHYRVINIPLVPESDLPQQLFAMPPNKIFGLTASPQSLAAIRRERLKSLGLPASAEYASTTRILQELHYAQSVMKKIGCAIIDVTSRSIEETADVILRDLEQTS